MGWKRLIMGEKMPDKNDPKYAERYEKEVNAGKRFARWLKIDKAAACIQRFAARRPKVFVAIVFAILLGCFALNVTRMVGVFNRPKVETVTTATQHQEELLKQKRNNKPINNEDNGITTEKDKL